MDNDWKGDRRALRTRLIAAREAMNDSTFERCSTAIAGFLARVVPLCSPRLLGFYWPHRREYDAVPIARELVANGGAAALPVVLGKGRPLEFRRWWPGIEMASGVYGIPYPAVGEAVFADVLLAPMVGFDNAGYRLGYGGGYYDRTLAADGQRPTVIGIGFEICRLDTIAPRQHDIPMDMIVTEAGIFRRENAALSTLTL